MRFVERAKRARFARIRVSFSSSRPYRRPPANIFFRKNISHFFYRRHTAPPLSVLCRLLTKPTGINAVSSGTKKTCSTRIIKNGGGVRSVFVCPSGTLNNNEAAGCNYIVTCCIKNLVTHRHTFCGIKTHHYRITRLKRLHFEDISRR